MPDTPFTEVFCYHNFGPALTARVDSENVRDITRGYYRKVLSTLNRFLVYYADVQYRVGIQIASRIILVTSPVLYLKCETSAIINY